MRKIKLYIAASLNNKIATKNGSVDWLGSIPNPEKTDYGYSEFYKSVDATIQGYATYKQLIDWGIDFPYADKTNYVLTRKKGLNKTEYVQFISENHIDFISRLKKKQGKDIWLIGGGQVNTFLLNHGLIDEMHLFIMPVILPGGIDLLEGTPFEKQVTLIGSSTHTNGVLALKYTFHNASF